MARNGSLALIAELPALQNLVQDEVIKFVHKWRSHFGRQAAGADTQLMFRQNAIVPSRDACAAQDVLTFLAASFTTGDEAQRNQLVSTGADVLRTPTHRCRRMLPRLSTGRGQL
jgi:hypothetical protein